MESTSQSPSAPSRPTWKETRAKLKVDHSRLVGYLGAPDDKITSAWCHPSFVCVFLYRVSNHFLRNGHKRIARLLWHLNAVVTGADISQYSNLEEGLVILTPAGVALMGTAGRNLTVMAGSGIGGEVGRWEDVGAGPGLPLLGEDVLLQPHSGVLGPVIIGDHVRIGPGVVVTRDVPDDAAITAQPARCFARRDLP